MKYWKTFYRDEHGQIQLKYCKTEDELSQYQIETQYQVDIDPRLANDPINIAGHVVRYSLDHFLFEQGDEYNGDDILDLNIALANELSNPNFDVTLKINNEHGTFTIQPNTNANIDPGQEYQLAHSMGDALSDGNYEYISFYTPQWVSPATLYFLMNITGVADDKLLQDTQATNVAEIEARITHELEKYQTWARDYVKNLDIDLTM